MTAPTPADAAWPVTTDRLLLRLATTDDARDLWRIRDVPGVTDWLTGTAGPFEAWRQRFVQPARLARTVVVEHDGGVVGDLMLLVGDAYAQAEVEDAAVGTEAEIGWVLDPAHGGRGIATEAVRALLGVCFDQLGLRRVTAGCAAENERSWRLMERVGMRREAHTVRSGLFRDGTWRDGYRYAILAEEWAAR